MGPDPLRVPLAHVCERITKGTTPTTIGGRFTDHGIKFIKVESITPDGRIDVNKLAYIDGASDGLLARSRLAADDILFTIAGTIGRVARVGASDLPANTNQAVAIVRPSLEKVDARFLFYCLKDSASARHALSRVVQSVQANFSLSELGALEVRVPPLSEQRVIADILGALDDKIELNRRLNETLETMARAAFKSWFVDFDAVRAKAEGHQPEGMNAETAALFPGSFEPSAIGNIPKGWRVAPIGDCVKVVGGSTPRTEEPSFWHGELPFATPKDMAGLTAPALLHTERAITESGLAQIGSGLLPKGTVLLSSRAPIGYLAIAEIPVAINQGFVAMICDGLLPNDYVLHWTRANLDTIIGNANGTTFLEISKKNFRPILALIPSRAILDAFERVAEPLHQRVVANLREARTLATLRDALLPKLLSGEIRATMPPECSDGSESNRASTFEGKQPDGWGAP